MIKRLGLWRFLRLCWGTFRWKYFPKESERRLDSRSSSDLERDKNTGSSFILALIIGGPLAFEPLILVALMGIRPENLLLVLSGGAIGIFMLSIPIVTLISMMVKINRHADEFFDEMGL